MCKHPPPPLSSVRSVWQQQQCGGGRVQCERPRWVQSAATVCERPHGVDQRPAEGQAEGGALGHVPGPARLRHGEGAGHVLCGGTEDLQLLQPGPGGPQPQSLQGWELLPGHQRSLSFTLMSVAAGELVSSCDGHYYFVGLIHFSSTLMSQVINTTALLTLRCISGYFLTR